MKTQKEIEELIQNRIDDIAYDNTQTRMYEEFYIKNDAKIQVLEEILRMLED